MSEHTEFYTAEEVAALLKLPRSTVYKLAQDANLPGFKVGKHWRFRRESIQQWVLEQETKQKLPHSA
jgi:excisionase family DNA binding protein